MGARRSGGLIATLTMNPSVDLSFAVDQLAPGRKLRCHSVTFDPGGGGVNVGRAVRRLGGRAVAIFPAGGAAGEQLKAMLRAEGMPHLAFSIAAQTRENLTAEDLANDAQYEFVMPGPRLKSVECAGLIEAAMTLTPAPAVLAASGSLPPGAPVSAYARLAARARRSGLRVALDAAGPALHRALAAGVWLVKPNLMELEEAATRPLPTLASRIEACRDIVDTGGAEMVALSLADMGALLVTREAVWFAAAPQVRPVSTVGAGDSFMAGLVTALVAGVPAPEALRRAVAAGTAALLAAGTQLCRAADVQTLLARIRPEQLSRPPRTPATRSPRAAA